MVNQISIYAENRKGAMRAITRILSGADINIHSFVTNDSAEFGIIRMLVSDTEKAYRLLNDAGYQVRQTSVMAIEIPDEPGSLDHVLKFIEQANININYLYTSFDRDGAGPIIAIHADDMDELEAFLSASGLNCR